MTKHKKNLILHDSENHQDGFRRSAERRANDLETESWADLSELSGLEVGALSWHAFRALTPSHLKK